MWFFNISLFPFLVFGIFAFLFAKSIGNLQIKRNPDSFLSTPIINRIFFVWTSRVIGVTAIGIFLYMGINRPYMGMMKKSENRLVLLEGGKITEGMVVKGWYDNWAPPAWMVLYNFKMSNPQAGEVKTYWGSARGPKKYYANLSEDDTVSIIYNPSNPKINCEIYTFLNDPSYRYTFKEAGKLELLEKFKDKYEFVDYSYMTWHNLSKQK